MLHSSACAGAPPMAASTQVSMTSCTLSFLVAMLLQVQLVAAQTSSFATKLNGGYITGIAPTQMEASAKFDSGIFIPTNVVTLTFDKALFNPDSYPNVVIGGGPASPPSFTTLASSDGKSITLTLASGAIGAGETIIFYVTTELAALPAVGPVTFTASSTADTAAVPPATVFQIIAAPTITLTSSDLNIGTVPFELRLEYDQPYDMLSGAVIVVRANRAVFASTQTTGLVATGVFGTYTTDYSGQSFTFTTSADTNRGQAIDMKLRSPLMAGLPDHAGPVFLLMEVDARVIFGYTTGFGTIVDPTPPPAPPPPTPPGPTPVSGDPVTYYNDKKIEFVLPWDVYTPMLQTPHMEVLALPIPGKDEDEQWIGRVVVKSANGEKAVQVDIKRNIDSVSENRSAAPANVFETLDVTLPWLHPKPLVNMPPRNILYFRQDIDIAFGKVPKTGHARSLRTSQQIDMAMPRREAVVVISPSTKILITSSSAWEWYGKTPDAVKYAHLDLEVFDMYNESSFGGVLPELWGIKAASARTKAMLKPLKPPKHTLPLELV